MTRKGIILAGFEPTPSHTSSAAAHAGYNKPMIYTR